MPNPFEEIYKRALSQYKEDLLQRSSCVSSCFSSNLEMTQEMLKLQYILENEDSELHCLNEIYSFLKHPGVNAFKKAFIAVLDEKFPQLGWRYLLEASWTERNHQKLLEMQKWLLVQQGKCIAESILADEFQHNADKKFILEIDNADCLCHLECEIKTDQSLDLKIVTRESNTELTQGVSLDSLNEVSNLISTGIGKKYKNDFLELERIKENIQKRLPDIVFGQGNTKAVVGLINAHLEKKQSDSGSILTKGLHAAQGLVAHVCHEITPIKNSEEVKILLKELVQASELSADEASDVARQLSRQEKLEQVLDKKSVFQASLRAIIPIPTRQAVLALDAGERGKIEFDDKKGKTHVGDDSHNAHSIALKESLKQTLTNIVTKYNETNPAGVLGDRFRSTKGCFILTTISEASSFGVMLKMLNHFLEQNNRSSMARENSLGVILSKALFTFMETHKTHTQLYDQYVQIHNASIVQQENTVVPWSASFFMRPDTTTENCAKLKEIQFALQCVLNPNRLAELKADSTSKQHSRGYATLSAMTI